MATDLVDKLWKQYKNKSMKRNDDESPVTESAVDGMDKEKEALNPNWV